MDMTEISTEKLTDYLREATFAIDEVIQRLEIAIEENEEIKGHLEELI